MSQLSCREAFQLLTMFPHNNPMREHQRLAGLRSAAQGGLPRHHPSLHFLPDGRQARVMLTMCGYLDVDQLSFNT
jgi:hypothetical protein